MNPAATTSEGSAASGEVEGACDVLALCEVWLALDFPDSDSNPVQLPATALPVAMEVS